MIRRIICQDRCLSRIKVLAAKGLVESRPKTGTRVRSPESWNLLDPDVLAWQQEGMPQPAFRRKLTEVRLIVEPAAAELAALRARPAELAAFEGAFREMSEALVRSPVPRCRGTGRAASQARARGRRAAQ